MTADAAYMQKRWRISIGDRIGRGADFMAALRAAWPKSGPQLPKNLGPAPYDLMALVCTNRIKAAYGAAGAAVPWALAERAAPPEKKPETVLRQWASAIARYRAGPPAAALTDLEAVVSRLAQNHVGPVWRQRTGFDEAPAVTLVRSRVLTFENGVLESRSLATGEVEWRRQVGLTEPRPIAVGDRQLLLPLRNAIEAIDAKTGRRQWRVELRTPRREVVRIGDLVFVADRETVNALELASGKTRWQYDGLATPVAGPVLVGDRLAVAMGGKVVLLNPADGRDEAVLKREDEISAPLVATDRGGLWGLVGSDDLVYAPPASKTWQRQIGRVPGVDWPLVAVKELGVLTAGTNPDQTRLLYVDPTTGRIKHRLPGVQPPVVALATGAVVYVASGKRALIARDEHARTLWTAKMPSEISNWIVSGAFVVAATDRTVHVLSAKTGDPLQTVTVDAPIRALAYGPTGGVVWVGDGALYGLSAPGDPRWSPWLRSGRQALIRAQVAAGRLTAARQGLVALENDGTADLDMLALSAEIESRLNRPNAVSAWLSVLAKSPPQSHSADRARSALLDQAGITAIGEFKAQAVRTSSVWLAVKTPDRIEGRPSSDLDRLRWTAPSAALGPARDGLVQIGARWHRFRDGQSAGDAGTEPLDENLLVQRTTAGRILQHVAEAGPGWSRPIPEAVTDFVVAGDLIILYGGRTIATWSTQTGEPRWQQSRPSPTLSIHRAGDTLILRTEGGLHALDAKTGKQRYRVAVPMQAQLWVDGQQAMFSDDREVKFIGIKQGRLRGRIKLQAPAERGWVAAGHLFVATADGQLIAVDARQRRALGRATLSIKDGSSLGQALALVDNDGRVLIIDATRALRPRR